MISKCRSVCFIKRSNSLTIIRKVVCLKTIKTYNISKLENVDFLKNGYSHNIQSLLTNGKKEIIFSTDYSCCTFTKEEVEYFLLHINSHIKNKMIG